MSIITTADLQFLRDVTDSLTDDITKRRMSEIIEHLKVVCGPERVASEKAIRHMAKELAPTLMEQKPVLDTFVKQTLSYGPDTHTISSIVATEHRLLESELYRRELKETK